MQILQKIQDSFPCTYMHIQVSTSYFKMLKQVSLYSKMWSNFTFDAQNTFNSSER